MKIEGNGKVTYEGRQFVNVKGMQIAEISRDTIKELVDEFFKIDYFALQDSFVQPITDLPSTTTSLSIDGRFKRVYNYAGAPQKLITLEHKVDQVAHSGQWVSQPEEK